MKWKIKGALTADRAGTIMMTPESTEDMWAVYNVLEAGDVVAGSTFRKVVRESASGASSSDRVVMRLVVRVTGVNFDSEAGMIRVTGRNEAETEHVKLGAFHTLELEPHRLFDVTKESWDTLHFEALKAAAAGGSQADIVIVLMDAGIAYVCAISGSLTTVRAKVETAVPKKHPGAMGGAHDRGVARFFEATMQAILRHTDLSPEAGIKAVIIASPGFLKDEFLAYMLSEASRRGLKAVTDARPRFVTAHASAGHPRALQGVLADPALAVRLAGTRALREVAALDAFLHALHGAAADLAVYGYRHVRVAADRAAVAVLMLSDALLRSRVPAVRAAYVGLVEDVRRAGGVTHVFSSGHVSGEALTALSGVAATLRFAVGDMDDAVAALSARLAALAPPQGGAGDGGGGGGDAGGGGGGGGGDAHGGALGAAVAALTLGAPAHRAPAAPGRAAAIAWDAAGDDSEGSSDSDASYKRPGGPPRPR